MPLDPMYAEIAPLLGHLVVEHNNFEISAGRMIARLKKEDDLKAGKYAAGLTAAKKIDEISKLVPQVVTDPDLKKEFDDLVVRMRTANARRNLYIHSEYMAELDAQDKYVAMWSMKLKDHGKNSVDIVNLLTPGKIKELVEELISLDHDTKVLAEKFIDNSL